MQRLSKQGFCLALGMISAFVRADIPPDQHAFFESKVRPLLVERCYECHSAEKTKGGLSLDSRASWQKGGDSGQVIQIGAPEESLLIKAIRHTDSDLSMPPKDKGGKLSAQEIKVLTEWVAMGAPDPREATAKIGGMTEADAKAWWAFQPLPKPEARPSAGKIDAFLETKFAARQLVPVPPADKRTLIRRISYGLTGLPPSPSEVDTFLSDGAPDATSKLVERLLASPQYGVHWGRHWLDVVRYADTAGENTDRPLPHAWRYRNWVTDAFNRDQPYDSFVRLQLAGDILNKDLPEQARNEGIIATTYLAVARRFGHDIDKDIHLMHEDVIDNLGKTFLGLTTACARCHDHKYDPITAQDYYALYGIFNSTRFAFPGCEPKGQPRDLVPLIPRAQADALLKPWLEKSRKFEAEKKQRAEAAKTADTPLFQEARKEARILAKAQVDEGGSILLSECGQQSLSNLSIKKGELLQLTVDPNASHGADSTLVEWRIQENSGKRRQWSVADLLQSFSEGNPHSADGGAQWCFLENTAKGPVFLTNKKESIQGNSALKAWSLGDEPSVFVNTSSQQIMVWTTLPAYSFFVHPGAKRPVAVTWISPFDGEVSISGRIADVHPSKGDGVSFTLEHIASPPYGSALVESGKRLLEKSPELEPPPVIPVAYAVAEGSIKNVRLQQRGDPEKPGDEVPRRWPSILGGDPVPADAGSGRRELGDWIVNSPVAARVMANRIWEWHFGKGLVRSSNDFGARGEMPSHPELLDWLAAQFLESGFSVKAMHRLILNTNAYQRASSTPSPSDPDNQLLSHFSRRRLTAEEMRDSLLAASGQLDIAPAEAHPFPSENSWKFSQHHPFNAVYETNKRSAYLMVQRQRRHPFLSLFDGADPNASTPSRQTTTVPTQALYFINDPFFHTQAAALAHSLMSLPSDTARAIEAFRILFQRHPSSSEQKRTLAFLENYPAASEERWAAQVRVLMASNEFLHVD